MGGEWRCKINQFNVKKYKNKTIMCLIFFIVHFIVITALKWEDRIGKMKENVPSLFLHSVFQLKTET